MEPVETKLIKYEKYLALPAETEVAEPISISIIEESKGELYDIPDYDTSFMAYMDYRTITDDTTPQWYLQQEAETSPLGLRYIDNYYLVAMGDYYGEVRDCFEITLENNITFKVMIGETKGHRSYKDPYGAIDGMYHEVWYKWELISKNVIEFIVDVDSLNEMVIALGNVGYYEDFNSNIIEIKKIS